MAVDDELIDQLVVALNPGQERETRGLNRIAEEGLDPSRIEARTSKRGKDARSASAMTAYRYASHHVTLETHIRPYSR